MPSVTNTKKINLLKKCLIFGAILVFAFSPLIKINTISAEVTCLPYNSAASGSQSPLPDGSCPFGTYKGNSDGTATASDVAAGLNTHDPSNNDGLITIANVLLQIVYAVTIGLGSAIASVGAVFLNYAVHISLDSSAYGLDFISQGWTTLRDIANMAFIFILLYIAIKVMFDANTAGTGGMLAKVLAVALVINFSFFATRVVVDAGNLLSVQFYNAIVGDAPNTNPVPGVQAGSVPDLTSKIMNGLQFQTALGKESFQQAAGGAGSSDFGKFGEAFIAYLFIYVVLGFMLLMLAGAFIAAGVKFIVRIVMLWYSIVTAPVALVAWAFQGGGGHGGGGHGYFSSWSKSLISNAFYPVVFLFILLMISNFMGANGAGGLGGGLLQESIATSNTSLASLAVIIANIAVRLGFVLVMLYYAIKASDYGTSLPISSWANSFGNNFAFGTPGALGRGILGRAGNFASQRIPENSVTTPLTNLLARSSYDPRAVLQKVPVVGGDFGAPKGQGGYLANGGQEANDMALIRRAIADPSSIHDHDKEHLNHVNPDLFNRVNGGDVSKLGGVLSDAAIKRIEASDKISAGKKEQFRNGWHDNASDSPAGKTNTELKELRDIAASMQNLEYIAENGTSVSLTRAIMVDQKLNTKQLRSMQETFKTRADDAKDDYKKAKGAKDQPGMVTAKNEQRANAAALEHLAKAIKSLEDVPAHRGGADVKGEITIK